MRSRRAVVAAGGGPPLVPPRFRRWVLVLDAAALGCILGLGLASRGSVRPLAIDGRLTSLAGLIPGSGGRLAVLAANGGEPLLLSLTVVAGVGLALLGDRRAAVATISSVGLAGLMVEDVLKPLFGRRMGALPAPVFPSGHAAVAMALAGAVVLAAGARRPLGRHLPPPARRALRAASVLAAGFVGVAVIVLQFHYPTDVVAGTALGLALSASVGALVDTWAAATRRGRRRGRRSAG